MFNTKKKYNEYRLRPLRLSCPLASRLAIKTPLWHIIRGSTPPFDRTMGKKQNIRVEASCWLFHRTTFRRVP